MLSSSKSAKTATLTVDTSKPLKGDNSSDLYRTIASSYHMAASFHGTTISERFLPAFIVCSDLMMSTHADEEDNGGLGHCLRVEAFVIDRRCFKLYNGLMSAAVSRLVLQGVL